MSEGWTLHARLAADTVTVADLPLCRLLLMRDGRFPWAILVPRVAGLTELHQLARDGQAVLTGEVDAVARALAGLPGITKINHGALGNLVPQFHWHVVARHPEDAAWPGPVWGSGAAAAPEPGWIGAVAAQLRRAVPDPPDIADKA
jgi:diadenosine tetraphosphate (Ap4A) HIT family hydrolase